MPLIKYLTAGAADALEYEATKRSIVRYLERYEREWGRVVSVREWEMTGCRPPEEGGRVMIRSRVIRALRELAREGILVQYEGEACWRLGANQPCPRCEDSGEIQVGGESLNPRVGVRGPDPQCDDVVRCPECQGGKAAT